MTGLNKGNWQHSCMVSHVSWAYLLFSTQIVIISYSLLGVIAYSSNIFSNRRFLKVNIDINSYPQAWLASLLHFGQSTPTVEILGSSLTAMKNETAWSLKPCFLVANSPQVLLLVAVALSHSSVDRLARQNTITTPSLLTKRRNSNKMRLCISIANIFCAISSFVATVLAVELHITEITSIFLTGS